MTGKKIEIKFQDMFANQIDKIIYFFHDLGLDFENCYPQPDGIISPDCYIKHPQLFIEYFGGFDIPGYFKYFVDAVNSYRSHKIEYLGLYEEDLNDLPQAWFERTVPVRLAEDVFRSVCGEGHEVGTPATFIRFSGCNLQCPYCDTKYSWGKGQNWSIRRLLDEVHCVNAHDEYSPLRNSVIFLTGGEVLHQPSAAKYLINMLRRFGCQIMLQTNGTIWNPEVFDLVNGLISVDIKGPSSKVKNNLDVPMKIYKRFWLDQRQHFFDPQHPRPFVQFKLLLDGIEDLEFAKYVVEKMSTAAFVLSPVSPVPFDVNEYLKRLSNVADILMSNFWKGKDVILGTQIHKFVQMR